MNKSTIVINLFGAPNAGKSTLAAGLFYELKMQGKSVEMVREWVKNPIWEGKKITHEFDYKILGEHTEMERVLFNKVDYIITDSPLILCAYYAMKRNPMANFLPIVSSFINKAKNRNISYVNFMINPDLSIPYDEEGRIHSQEESRVIQEEMEKYIKSTGENFTSIHGEGRDRVQILLKEVLKQKPLQKD